MYNDVQDTELSGTWSDCSGDLPLVSSRVSARNASFEREIDWERGSSTRRLVFSATLGPSSADLTGLVFPIIPLRTTTVPLEEGLLEGVGKMVFVPGDVGGRDIGT